MKSLFLILLLFFRIPGSPAPDFQVREWIAPVHDKPMIFVITGDGGFKSFITDLCSSMNKQGYDVFALNAKSYFWNKKSPEQTTDEISTYLGKKMISRQNQQLVFAGYSFGADVSPFIMNRLPLQIRQSILSAVLMAPSESTDFEIHITDILGGNMKRSMDVVTEINKLGSGKLVLISGTDDNDFPAKKITLRNFTHEVLPGGHHFDGNAPEVAAAILKGL